MQDDSTSNSETPKILNGTGAAEAPANNSRKMIGHDRPFPIPVPPHMRTRRIGPRIIAGAFVITWIVVFYFGTSALARRDMERGFGREEIIEVGTKYWAFERIAQQPDGKTDCVGTMQLTVQDTPALHVTADGTFRIIIAAQSSLLTLGLNSEYGEFNELTKFSLAAGLGSIDIKAKEHAGQPELMSVAIRSPSTAKALTLPRPRPIFLVRKGVGMYALHLPRLFGTTSPASNIDVTALRKISDTSIREVTSTEFDRCRADLQNPEGTSQGIDITNLLGAFHFKPSEDRLKEITDASHG